MSELPVDENTPRILVVEDELKTGNYLKQGLMEAGFVVDLDRNGRKSGLNGRLRTVSLTGLGEGAVERHDVTVGVRALLQKARGGALRPHGVRARRTAANFVNLPD